MTFLISFKKNTLLLQNIFKTQHCSFKIKFLPFLALLIFSICISPIGLVFAQNQIGISKGDVFTYEITNSNIPSIYQIVLEPKSASMIQIQITSVASTKSIGLNITETFKNGSKTSWLENKDLTLASNFPITFANLNINDPLWSGESLSPIIKEITNQSYPAGTREMIIADVASLVSGYDQVIYNFDRRTGMPIEIRFIESDDISTIIKLSNTSVWTIPELSPFAIFALASITMLSIIIYKSKKHFKLNY